MNYTDAAKLIKHWMELSEPKGRTRTNRASGWAPVECMVEAARHLLITDRETLESLLNQSDQRLCPLIDPLRTDFAVHRWLANKREEAYSDWLAWVVRQVDKPELVFQLFQISPPADLSDWSSLAPIVEREVPVPAGRKDQSGRLDVVVRYPGRALLVVEVKLSRAVEADLGGLPGYSAWMVGQPETTKVPILLVIASEDKRVDSFEVRRWRDLCLEVRRIVRTLCETRGIVAAAMALAFAGAVEQNLMGLPAEPVKSLQSGRLLNVAETLTYLDVFLRKSDGTR